MFWQALLFVGQMILGEVTRQRPKRTTFEDLQKNNQPDELRPIPYGGGTFELTPARMWYGDYKQRAVERDSHWTDYIWLGSFAFLLDTITVAYRSYIGEMFPLCWGPDVHVERITINDRPVFAATVGSDNSGGGFLIDDPQAWGGDQPPGEGGEYAWCDLTRGNYTDHTNSYLESLLTTAPNKTPSLRGIAALVKRGPSGFTESGYFAAGGVGSIPRFKQWKITCRRQPDNLATRFNKIGRHMNPMEAIYEWSTSLEYGARVPVEELNLNNWRSVAEDLYNENNGWSGVIETSGASPQQVVQDVLAQIDAVPEPSPSLGLTIRLIRRDYSFNSLRVLSQDNITRVERFTPGTYEDTKNKIQVEFPDQGNNFKGRKALYIDPANQLIQDGRTVPETKTFLGVADFEQANVIATRDGRAISLPRAPLECFVFASFGRLTYRGEVLLFEWESPTFSIVMRVLAITPNGPDERDYRLVLIEDQFSTGLRTFGEPSGTQHEDPATGLDTAPPSASWNEAEFDPDGLKVDLILTNTNQFQASITGGIIFGAYAPGGQYARLYVTEPGGVQALSPAYLWPDNDNKDTFTWPALAVGPYQFCVQTFSTRTATNGVKVCATIDVSAIGSPSLSPSASVSPSHSASPSVSPSASVSPSSSQSPSSSLSPSASQSPSSSASASTSSSVSPSSSSSASPSPSTSISASVSPSASASPSHSTSASQSPSSSISPSAPPFAPDDVSGITEWVMADQSSLSGFNDGDTVTDWLDQITGTRKWTQSTTANKPLFKTGGANGKPYLRFADSTDQYVFSNTLSTIYSTTAWTTFIVIRPQANGGSNQNTAPFLFSYGGGQGGINLKNDGSNRFGVWQRSGGSDGTFLGSTSTYTQNVWYIVECWYDGTNINIKVNNDTTASTARGSASTSFTAGIGSNGLTSDIAERVTYNVDIGSTNRASVRQYLADKYGITLA
jgi:hypothetical protein